MTKQMCSYPQTKKFIDWLAKVRPEFKIKNTLRINKDDELDFIEHTNGEKTLPVITTDTLHTILWELFEKKPFQPHPDFLWKYYTSSKDSWWLTKPDEVLEDIVKTYDEINQPI